MRTHTVNHKSPACKSHKKPQTQTSGLGRGSPGSYVKKPGIYAGVMKNHDFTWKNVIRFAAQKTPWGAGCGQRLDKAKGTQLKDPS